MLKDFENKLTNKQSMFCQEYLIDINGTKAAVRAGFSRKTAAPQASRLLRNVKVQKEIQKLMNKRALKIEINAESVLNEIAKLAFANMMDYITINSDGLVDVDLSKLTRDQAAAIQEITADIYIDRSMDADGERVKKVKFKLSDKSKNLELLGRHLKMFTDKVEHGIKALEELAEAKKEVKKLTPQEVIEELEELINVGK